MDTSVCQADPISFTIFSIFINELVITEFNSLNIGIKITDMVEVCCLLDADDLSLVACNETDLQQLLDCLNIWCHKWRLKLNITKSNVNHFRNVPKRRSEVDFNIGTDKIDYVSSYKYLGLILDEHLTFSEAIKDYVTVQTED